MPVGFLFKLIQVVQANALSFTYRKGKNTQQTRIYRQPDLRGKVRVLTWFRISTDIEYILELKNQREDISL